MLAVHVLTSQSMLHAEMARTALGDREPARQALRLAYQTADEGRYLPMPALHALIALRHASAASLLGDKAAFHSAIGQARRELDRGPRDGDPPQRLRFVSETEITTTEATGYLNLGDPGRSAMLYRQALASGMSPRERAKAPGRSEGVQAVAGQLTGRRVVAVADRICSRVSSGSSRWTRCRSSRCAVSIPER
jgi:hypothetical protein